MKKLTCKICSSTKLFKDSLGSLTCHRGHVITQYREEYAEEGAQQNSQRIYRKKIITRRKIDENLDKFDLESKIFQVQNLLKMQVEALISKFRFPQELKSAVGDLWLLFVTFLDIYQCKKNVADLDKLKLAERSFENLEPQVQTIPLPTFSDRQIQVMDNLSTSYSIIFCYLGSITLRLPVIWNDFIRWASSNHIPYFTSSTTIRNNSNIGIKQVKKKTLCPFKVQKDVHSIITLFKEGCSINFPEINFVGFWIRIIELLKLPKIIYKDTYTISHRITKNDSENSNILKSHLMLVCLVIVAIKLRYGDFDLESGQYDINLDLNFERVEPYLYSVWNPNSLKIFDDQLKNQYVEKFANEFSLSQRGSDSSSYDLLKECLKQEKTASDEEEKSIKFQEQESEKRVITSTRNKNINKEHQHEGYHKTSFEVAPNTIWDLENVKVGPTYNKLVYRCAFILGCLYDDIKKGVSVLEKKLKSIFHDRTCPKPTSTRDQARSIY